MAEDFKIEVPITLKSGREGEKIGTQIGEKIAEQLKKTFKSINIGGPKAGGDSAGVLGIAKGLKGVATKLGIVGAAIAATVKLLAKASPYLKGILSIFGRAFLIFFRPFGDFLATLLKPMAILLMKMAVAFLKWTKPFLAGTREAMEGAFQFEEVNNSLANFAIGIANWHLRVAAAMNYWIEGIGKGAFDLGVKIGDWFYEAVIVPVAAFIRQKLAILFPSIGREKPINKAPYITDQESLVEGITGRVVSNKGGPSALVRTGDIETMMKTGGGDVLKALGNGSQGGGKSLFGGASVISNVVSNSLVGTIGKIIGGLFGGKGQVGIPKVQKDGLFLLHRGEEVVTRNNQSKSVILNQNLNFSGPISSDVDVDEIARRSSRITEMELKKRGII